MDPLVPLAVMTTAICLFVYVIQGPDPPDDPPMATTENPFIEELKDVA